MKTERLIGVVVCLVVLCWQAAPAAAQPDLETHFNDVWEFDLTTKQWTELSPTGPIPTPRRFSSAGYDPLRQRLIIHGGMGADQVVFGDTFALDVSSGGFESWELLDTSGSSPGVTAFFPGVVDAARDRFLILLNDTLYALDLTGNVWSVVPAWGQVPPGHPSAYLKGEMLKIDAANDRMIFFGGALEGNDTYSLNLGTDEWTLLLPPPPIPAERNLSSLQYDADNNRMLLFGGHVPDFNFGDTWALTLTPGSETWTELFPPKFPQARGQHASAFDTLRGRKVIFGGLVRGLPTPPFPRPHVSLDDIWAFNGAAWTDLSPSGGDLRAWSRRGAVMIYDPANDRIVMFGGQYFGFETIVIDDCDTGVVNLLPGDDGRTMADFIAECADDAENHGAFVSCVAHLTKQWRQDGLISGQEQGRIQQCAAQADIPCEIGHQIVDQIDLDHYRHYLDDVLYTHDGDNRGRFGPEHDPARDAIAATFESFGLEVELHAFEYAGSTYYNVVATQPGTVFPDAQYIVGGHFDSVDNPGADDNPHFSPGW